MEAFYNQDLMFEKLYQNEILPDGEEFQSSVLK